MFVYNLNCLPAFTASPPLRVAADIVIKGFPNATDYARLITKSQGQSPGEVIQASLTSFESVTKTIAEGSIPAANGTGILVDLLTADCYSRLRACFTETLTMNNNTSLINILKEDVFFAWLQVGKGIIVYMYVTP